MPIVMNTSGQVQHLSGGTYIISTFLEGGTATLELQHKGSDNWKTVGELQDTMQTLTVPKGSKIRLTKTGDAYVEISA